MLRRRLIQIIPAHLRPVIVALLWSNAVSVTLFLIRALSAHNLRYGFLLWNLFLAYLPLQLAYILHRHLEKHRWHRTGSIILTLLWLGFLPNSFYLASDLVHLEATGEISKLFDATMFVSFIFNAFVAGFLSIYLLHTDLIKRYQARAHWVVGLVFAVCGFAVYLGRYLRWNSWDVVTNPTGLLFDVSEQVLNPFAHPESFLTTLTFFLLLGSMYAVIWQFVRLLKRHR